MIPPTLARFVHRTAALFFNWTEAIFTLLSAPISLLTASVSDSEAMGRAILGDDPEVLLALPASEKG